ncbi:hypothetical protein [Mameliella sediminis]|uniref:hypothetical protein n=1 Tax=Mameliella sediminis TaxID=2836866 RepID=UPI001C4403FB|nr:hypothetical protein [Mameliella sediminis]MBV7393261.1 hypothetical protein [Mameliella sediminis]
MTKLSPLDMAKRAAARSPIYKTAVLYGVAHDNGTTAFTAEGNLQFDRLEQTFGYVDMSRETTLTAAQTYEGDHLLTVLTAEAPNGVALILLDGRFYTVQRVQAGDALGVSVTFACNSIPDDEPPEIRNA